jgi:putative SOS response-associated peptidase YedK
MCGRFVITSPPAAVRQAFGYSDQPNFPPRYNIAPTQPIPVVIAENGARRFHLMRWGLLPSWVKDPRNFTLLINARSETVIDKPAFRNAMKRRRCLVPADGYYEWQTIGQRKQPYFIHPRDGVPIGFAALAETWTGPNGEELDTVAILTTAASADMAPLHSRVPVTIAPENFARWLDCAGVDADDAAAMLKPPAAGQLVWHLVSTAVNRVANDDAQLILPISEQELADITVRETKSARKSAARKPAAPAPDEGGQGSLF